MASTPVKAPIPLLTTVGSLVCALVCVLILHGADDRSDAGWLVPVAWVWGSLAAAAGLLELRDGPRRLGALLATAFAIRVVFVGTPWLLSDDAWRFLWEGTVLAAGHNPFSDAPASLPGLDDALLQRVNHPDIPSIYPPWALVWFRALHLMGGRPVVVQCATMMADLVALYALVKVSGRMQAGWIYALHPLPVLESAASAHLEAPALALAGLGLLAWKRNHDALAWIGLTGAAMFKLLPALALPGLMRRPSPYAALGASIALLLGIGAAWPVLGAGGSLFQAFGTYARHWSFNGFLWPWLDPMLGGSARPLLVVGAGAFVAWTALRRGDPLELLAAAGAAFILTSPTVHPWYALWALWPALALGRWHWAMACTALLGGYCVLFAFDPLTSTWSEPAWLWWVTWPPVVLFLLAGAKRDRTELAQTTP